jgi:hypothetical protein
MHGSVWSGLVVAEAMDKREKMGTPWRASSPMTAMTRLAAAREVRPRPHQRRGRRGWPQRCRELTSDEVIGFGAGGFVKAGGWGKRGFRERSGGSDGPVVGGGSRRAGGEASVRRRPWVATADSLADGRGGGTSSEEEELWLESIMKEDEET